MDTQGRILDHNEMPETLAAYNAGQPWIGILAREQINLQLANGDDMAPELRAVVELYVKHIGMLVESVCTVSAADNGMPVYGINAPNNEELFMFLVTDKSQAVVGMKKAYYDEQLRPPVDTDHMLWGAIYDFINDATHVSKVPTLVGWRLGKETVDSLNLAMKQIVFFGNTPCLFVFASKTETASGGLITMVSLPPSVQRQMSKEIVGHA